MRQDTRTTTRLCAVLLACACATTAHAKPTASDPEVEWAKASASFRDDKKAMCSFLMNTISDRDVKLTVDGVAELFEQSLDHIGKAATYLQRLQALNMMQPEAVHEFDKSGSRLVLQISDQRRALIDDYVKAANEGGDAAQADVLDTYFYKACENKLATIISENSMYTTVLRAEKVHARRNKAQPSTSV